MLQKRRKLLLGLLGVLLLLVSAYAWFGYLHAPKLLREKAVAGVRAAYERELTLGEVRMDPFRLRLEIRGLALPVADGQPLLAVERLLVDFELASLWRRALVFKAIELDAPSVRAVLREDGRFNLADLANPRRATPVPPPEDKEPPRLWVRQLRVSGGNAQYVIATRRPALTKHVEPINFSLQDFRTTRDGGRFTLSAQTVSGEQLDWRGRIALAPQLASDGEFSVARLHVATVLHLLPVELPLGVESGLIDLAGSYRFALGEQSELAVSLPELKVSELSLGEAGGEMDWIRATGITLEGTDFDLAARRLHSAALRVEGLQARSWIDADGRVNLAQLFFSGGADSGAAAPATGALASPAGTGAQAGEAAGNAATWSAELGALQVSGAQIGFEDRRIETRPRFELGALDLSTGALSLQRDREIQLRLATRINDAAQLQLEGALVPAPLKARLKLDLDDAPLSLLQPYLLPVADLSIRSGAVSTGGELEFSRERDQPLIGYDGDLTLANLHTVDNTLGEDLLNVGRLQVQRLRYRSAPASLAIGRILVQEPYARLVISPQRVTNIQAVFDPEGAAAKLAGQADPGDKAAAEEQAQQAARREAAPTAPAEGPERFPIRIGEVRVADGRMNFADFYIQPNFSAEILDLSGTISELSSARDSRAIVDLKGNVGEFSPMSIGGSIQPFAFDRHSDIAVRFQNIALPVFNPYSGTFAGYNIAKGSLSTDIHYLIAARQLTAEHRIRIDQLEWGEASEFKGEATLPVKFATALLRDRNGVINLELPLSGSLDDPSLRIGPLVWQVIRNVILKAATAPFALLGSLFAGAEEAQFVDFAPGDATLDAVAGERLAQLAKGLAERPGVSLDIPLAPLPAVDRPVMLQRRYQALLEAIALSAAAGAQDSAAAAGYAALSAMQKRAALAAWYRGQGRELPAILEPPAPPEGASRAEARELADQAAVAVLEQALEAGITLQDGELEQLAQARASAIQAALLGGGELDAARVFIVRADRAELLDGKVRLTLELE